MNCERKDEDGATRLVIKGALDAITVPDIRPIVESIVDDGAQRVIVDMKGVTVVDSSGVAMLTYLYKRIRSKGGEFVVVDAKDQPLAAFKFLRVDRIFGI